ncbi:MAG: T9SS type A sorting domain-containing protein, partial [Bacteroidota bacterium]
IWVVKTDSNGYAPGMHFLGINEVSKENKGDVRVFPNPATNQTTIVYPQLIEEGTIHIYNMLGQIVYEDKLEKGSSQSKISIQHLKAGLFKVIIREKGIIKGEVSLVKE